VTQKTVGSAIDEANQLGQDEIIEAALALAREKGLQNLTMRDLARDLGVTPMATYYYVKNKAELLILVADSILGQVEIPPRNPKGWKERQKALLRSAREVMLDYPGMDSVMLDVGVTPNGRRMIDATIDNMRDAGFDEREAELASGLLMAHSIGRLSVESRSWRDQHQAGRTQSKTTKKSTKAELHRDDYFEFAIDAMVDGLETRLRKQKRQSIRHES
jgi:TetR/AcrR family tetracycline transcriptional repressor